VWSVTWVSPEASESSSLVTVMIGGAMMESSVSTT